MQNLAKQLLTLKVQSRSLNNQLRLTQESGIPDPGLCVEGTTLFGKMVGILQAASELLPANQLAEFLAFSETESSEVFECLAQFEELSHSNPSQSSHAE